MTKQPKNNLFQLPTSSSLPENFTSARALLLFYRNLSNYTAQSRRILLTTPMCEVTRTIITTSLQYTNSLQYKVSQTLERFVSRYKVGQWLLAQTGLGAVGASTFLLSFDIRRAPHPSNFWAYCGLRPESWKHRRFNRSLKYIVLGRIGKLCITQKHREHAFYAQLYVAKLAQIQQLNAEGRYAARAAALLKLFPRSSRSSWWRQNQLHPSMILCYARRWTTKLFLSHLHHVMYEDYYGHPPPRPFAVEYLGRTQVIPPHLWPLDAQGKPYTGISLREVLTEHVPQGYHIDGAIF